MNLLKKIYLKRAFTSERPTRFEGIVEKKYLLVLSHSKNKRVLDIGCGLGDGPYLLAENGAKYVLGIDNSKPTIEYARLTHKHKNLSYLLHDAMHIEKIDRQFDVISCLDTIEHIPRKEVNNFLKKISRLLTQKGVCIISTVNANLSDKTVDNKPCNPYHDFELSAEELKKLCSKYFKNIKAKGIVCLNKQILSTREDIKTSFRHKIVNYLNQFKFIQEMLPFIPAQIKHLLSQENKYPKFSPADFKLVDKNIENIFNIVLICSNKKSEE